IRDGHVTGVQTCALPISFLAIRASNTIAGLFLITYGIGVMIRGYLIARSGYIPKVLGILFMIGGVGFILRTTTYLLAPTVSSDRSEERRVGKGVGCRRVS